MTCLICAYKHTTIASTLIFIFDSSVKATVFQYSTVFPFICLTQFILLFLFLALMKSFLRACLPLYPSDFSRLLVLSLTDFWISSPHFCAKTLAGQLSSLLSPIFISANDLLTLEVFGGLPLRFAVWMFL